MLKFAVFGTPINHSLSPAIHQLFAKQCGVELKYDAINPQDFVQEVKSFFNTGSRGCNITLPYKADAYHLADRVQGTAKIAKACNTLSLEEGKIIGYNTDGYGLVRDLERNWDDITDKRILLIGAGGAASGVAPALLQAGGNLCIVNRTVDKGHVLAQFIYKILNKYIKVFSFEELAQEDYFDVLINATSASIANEELSLPNSLLSSSSLCYEMLYGNHTPFMQWGLSSGASVMDGMGMLIEQAAESFFIWHGIRVDTQRVLEELIC